MKINLQEITSLNVPSVLNSNFDKIKVALEEQVLFRDVPAKEPNALKVNIDVNGKKLYNLPEPIYDHQAARLKDVKNGVAGVVPANMVPFTPYGTVEATNVQGAIQEMLDEASSSSSSDDTSITLPNSTLDSSVAINALNFWDTSPNGWNEATGGKQVVEFDFYLDNLFTLNPNCHFGVILRSDPAGSGTYVNGHGYIVGALSANFNEADSPNVPLAALETWYGASGGNYVWKNSELTRTGEFTDGSTYRTKVESTLTASGEKYIRATTWKRVVSGAYITWENIFDTGDVYDHNALADFTKSGVSFFVVFGGGPGYTIAPGSGLQLTNLKVSWGPVRRAVPDVSTKLSRYGASLEGDITFIGNGRKFKLTNTGDPSLWTAFQAKEANNGTSVLAKPNGTATFSEFFAVNKSVPSSLYSGVVLGAGTTKGYLRTYNVGTSSYSLDVDIGAGNTVATFNSTGLRFPSATKNVNTSWVNQLVNPGGTNAYAYVNSPAAAAIPLEWWCTSGNIASFLPASPSDADVETVLRPLYCMFSALYKELIDRKVL